MLLAVLPLRAADVSVLVVDADLGLPLEGARLQCAALAAVATDAEGLATLAIADDQGRLLVTVLLPGYDNAQVWVKPGDTKVTIKMSIANVVEGEGLVVEASKPGKTDEQPGVSQVATREEIRSTAEIGIVEDLMSTIKLLPGVGYVGGWNAMPSIRGGDPTETSAVLDGAYVQNPYEWGGAFSIFDPNMVESAKLSNGLISARYGEILSGLLEVNSKSSKASRLQVDASLSTTGLDLYAQGPIGKDVSFLLGGKITWMEVPFTVMGQADNYSPVPYIRNGYARLVYKPSDRFEGFVNSFIDNDGIGVKMDSAAGSSDILTSGSFRWNELNLIETVGAKIFAGESSVVDLLASYNNCNSTMSLNESLNGTHEYDQAFKDAHALGADGYTLENFDLIDVKTVSVNQTYQAKASWDWEFLKGQIFSIGAESVLDESSYTTDQDAYVDVAASDGTMSYSQKHFHVDASADKMLRSGAFALCEFNLLSGAVTGEAGLRVNDDYLYNDDISIKTRPTIDPRLRLEIIPWTDLGWIKALGISAGSGLYTKMPMTTNLFDASLSLGDYSVSPTRSWFSELGLFVQGEDDWKISLEGYYKRYYDRIYIVLDSNAADVGTTVKNDGVGYAYGADLFVLKRLGRYWDGWLTYSYSVSRYYDPTQAGAGLSSSDGEPLGSWYYPTYQRFHTANLVLDWKPTAGFTATFTGTIASGAPKQSVGPIVAYASSYTDSSGKTQTIERYARTSAYSDELRNDLSCPVDIKLSWSGFYPRTKIRWECYFGVENIFANLYSPKTNKAFDPFTGQELSGSGQADFSIGFPIPSFGYKLSY
jgi:hypothetical protein